MTLQEAAEILDLPKKKLWRAVKANMLNATQKQVGNRWEYRVTRADLDAYRQEFLESSESLEAVPDGRVVPSRQALLQLLEKAEARSRSLEHALSESTKARARLERDRDALVQRLNLADGEAKAATLYLKEARTLIRGWDERRRSKSVWQRVASGGV